MGGTGGGGVALALAHPGLPPEPHDLLTAWTWEPTVLLGLALTGWLYGRGVWTLWRRAGRGRSISESRVACFVGGMVTLLAALVSPIDALGSALLSAHMVQHTLLTLVAAPLLVFGRPHVALCWALPPDVRRRFAPSTPGVAALRTAWRVLTVPASVWVLHAAATWVWHLPGPYQMALASEGVHAVEHLSFVATALLFWWVLPGVGPHPRLHPVGGALFLFTFMLQGGALSALITFSGSPWYPAYAATTPPWGVTPLADQQLAGMIMWVPAGLVYVVAALVPLGRWIETGSEPAPVVERRPTVSPT